VTLAVEPTILVRLIDGTFEAWQTKRHRAFKPSDVRAAIRLFLKHKWASQAKRFLLAVACELDATAVVDAIESAVISCANTRFPSRLLVGRN